MSDSQSPEQLEATRSEIREGLSTLVRENLRLKKQTATYRHSSIALIVAAVLGVSYAVAAPGDPVPHTLEDGDLVNPAELNANFSELANQIGALPLAPLGSIVAWHPDVVSPRLAIPAGWVECNGQGVNVEAGGPLDTSGTGRVQVPNLNTDHRFLRGNDTSGAMEEDQLEVHSHDFSLKADSVGHVHTYVARQYGNQSPSTGYLGTGTNGVNISDGFEIDGGEHEHPISGSVDGPNSGNSGSETRPINMNVVWIMRVR